MDPTRGGKITKSKGGFKLTPPELIESYSADAVRYWASNARLGTDTAFDEQMFKIGRRLVTKLFNAGKFVLAQEAEQHPITDELDRSFVAKLSQLVAEATQAFESFEFARALMLTEQFFWASFTDTYLELAKGRSRGELGDARSQGSAVATLRLGLNVLLRLLAPMLPYITEEVWSWVFAEETGHASIDRAPWPSPADFETVEPPADAGSFDSAVEALAVINKKKSEAGVSVGRVTEELVFAADEATRERLERVWLDVTAAARCQSQRLETKAELDAGAFEVLEARFAEKPPKKK